MDQNKMELQEWRTGEGEDSDGTGMTAEGGATMLATRAGILPNYAEQCATATE